VENLRLIDTEPCGASKASYFNKGCITTAQTSGQGDATVIAFLIIVYVSIVLVLFKVLRIKPTAYLIAAMFVAGVFMIGGVVVVWSQSAPITDKMVTSHKGLESKRQTSELVRAWTSNENIEATTPQAKIRAIFL
jgi:hypothetical protein